MNWHIGQDIVCIKNHSQGIVKKGETFIITGIKKGCCKILIDIGYIVKDFEGSNLFQIPCDNCKKILFVGSDNTHWLNEELFAPLDTLIDISEIEEIINEPLYQK